MSQTAIRVHNLGKRYRLSQRGEIYNYKSLRDTISNVLYAPYAPIRTLISRTSRNRLGQSGQSGQSAFGNPPSNNFIWALKDVSFEVKPGEVLGIIGRNGAGKTTLLKILSRITEPTEGYAEVRGRVGSLLEIGTGFHPELTGRENIYFNGSILGMKKAEIDRRFDEIVSFAELEKFVDTPVKYYSSGMHVRLAFAVAAHLETEILLVDEVLAVGDVAFQRKCLGKMEDAMHRGRTVLFVSHSMNVVAQLCQEAIVLNQGRLVLKAPTSKAIAEYLSEMAVKGGQKRWSAEELQDNEGLFRPIALTICDQEGKVTDQLASSEPFWIEIEYDLSEDIKDLRVGIMISGGDGTLLFGAFDTDDLAQYIERRPVGRYRSRCRIPDNWLNEGCFIVGINAGIFSVGQLFQDEHVLRFDVIKTGGAGSHWHEVSGGFLRPLLEWRIECLEQ